MASIVPMRVARGIRITLVAMRLTEFWQRMDARFGGAYARSVAADYRISALGSTVNEALENGIGPKEIWRAVCTEFEVPSQLH